VTPRPILGSLGSAAALTFALVALLWAPAARAAVPQTSLPDVEDEVMCTICGTLLAESESPQADRERALIRRLIARGEDKQQIEDRLVAQYGPQVLATPSGHGFDLLAWLVPVLALAAALMAVGVTLKRRRAARPTLEAEPPALDSEDLARLDRDMSAYDG
jgi:cytochrome c-type biogenesis protein CcmH